MAHIRQREPNFSVISMKACSIQLGRLRSMALSKHEQIRHISFIFDGKNKHWIPHRSNIRFRGMVTPWWRKHSYRLLILSSTLQLMSYIDRIEEHHSIRGRSVIALINCSSKWSLGLPFGKFVGYSSCGPNAAREIFSAVRTFVRSFRKHNIIMQCLG